VRPDTALAYHKAVRDHVYLEREVCASSALVVVLSSHTYIGAAESSYHAASAHQDLVPFLPDENPAGGGWAGTGVLSTITQPRVWGDTTTTYATTAADGGWTMVCLSVFLLPLVVVVVVVVVVR
jgi:hypothetical protein